MFLRAARSLEVGGLANRHLHLKQRQRGFDEGSWHVESFLVLNALGGECLEDFDRLREDDGLREMLGHEVPSPEAARKFLYQFHEEEKLHQAQSELPAGQVSYIPDERCVTAGFGASESGSGARDRTAVWGSEDRYHRSGRDHH